jgi:hypothetical protein
MSYTIKGAIQTIHDLTAFKGKDGSDYQKQIFTVVNNDGYEGREQLFAIELFGDKTQLLNSAKEGDQVTVECNVNCRHWKEDRYFVSLQAWKIEKESAIEAKESYTPKAEPVSAPALPQSDDLPF